MVKTRRGVYHNLNDSEYATSNGEVAFFFSSRFYQGKFLKEFEEHRNVFRKRISRTMVVEDMNTDFLADIHLYRDIEKRGFRVIFLPYVAKNVEESNKLHKKGELSWQETHEFALVKMTEKNTLDWYEMSAQK